MHMKQSTKDSLVLAFFLTGVFLVSVGTAGAFIEYVTGLSWPWCLGAAVGFAVFGMIVVLAVFRDWRVI